MCKVRLLIASLVALVSGSCTQTPPQDSDTNTKVFQAKDSRPTQDVSWTPFQFTGVFDGERSVYGLSTGPLVHNDTTGVALGLFCETGEISGISVAGFAQDTDTVAGIQISGFINGKPASGPWYKFVRRRGSTVVSQSAPFATSPVKKPAVKGAQVAAIWNGADSLYGSQFSLVNTAERGVGCQVGLFNWAGSIEDSFGGVQIGFVNKSDNWEKRTLIQIGLFNFTKLGKPGFPIINIVR